MIPHQRFSTSFGGKELIIETGRFAERANAAVTATYGETVVLATVVMGKEPREGIDYFPLTLDYDEKLYAAGRIKGSRWVKREGKPTDEAILSGRLIDRVLRPLFDKRMRNEVQIIVTVLSFDEENDPDIVALIAASTALAVSDIPWNGPIGGVRAGYLNDDVIINPNYEQREQSSIDIVLAGTKERINMIEAKAREVLEDRVVEVAGRAQGEIKSIIEFQEDIVASVGQKTADLLFEEPKPEFEKDVLSFLNKDNQLEDALYGAEPYDRMEKANMLKQALGDYVAENYDASLVKQGYQIFENEVDRIIHERIINKGERPDNRGCADIREVACAVGVLPRTHGSGLFQRGQTQALSVLTLGAPGAEQMLEGMEIVGKKRFMHHYNFPPFSTGEVGRLTGPGRREIGHGALAEKALEPLIPDSETFPYTIRIVSEILSSNGSSSMASVCGSSLALMDAGVPVKRPAAGIAMGLMMEDVDRYKILTDIQGPEDHHGDMDLKVAGTSVGITAMQMDVKIAGITLKILQEALSQAKEARMQILEKMLSTISEPRKNLSPHAPRVISIKINPDRIKDVIGPGGKTIHAIIEETGVDIDIEDEGIVFITSKDERAAAKAIEWVKNITREVVAGEIFQGKVVKVLNFGAFVEILPGHQGLLHISELAPYHVKRVEDVIKVGDVVPVKVKDIDTQGRIALTMNNHLKQRASSPRANNRYKFHGKDSFIRSKRQRR